jgi:hypothetical protein
VSDTSAEMEDLYRGMILSQTPARRVAMACGMYSTAKALVRAGILAECGGKEPPDFRERLFLRMYGPDFTPSDLEKILAHLRSG